MPSLVFKDAEQARDSICINDQRKIRDLYAEWADKVAERAEFYEKKTTASSYWQQQQMLELERQLRSQSMQIHREIEAGSKSSMYMIADSVVGCNAEFLKDLGFKEEGINAAFTSIPNRVVSNIVTGQIYKSGWSLSKAIWTDNQKTLSDIYSIVAQGRAMNMSAYEVSKMLEKYVSPGRKMQWNLKMRDGVKIYKKTVDYNAQRLVRTLNQHAYQQSVIQVVKDNPFIPGIYWRSNGSRVCPLCMDRDGNFYKWNELPMDHPNGMCTMEPATDMDKTIDQLADWIKEPDGTYPEIDKFAEKLGYEPKNKVIVQVNNSNQKTNSEHYVVQGKDITSTWKRRSDQFDFEIEDVINAQGFDGKPRVVGQSEFDKAVEKSGIIAKRGYTAPSQEVLDEYHKQLIDGKWYVDCSNGGAMNGQGMYAVGTYGKELNEHMQSVVNGYGASGLSIDGMCGKIETFTFDPSVKIIKNEDVAFERQNMMYKFTKELLNEDLSNDDDLILKMMTNYRLSNDEFNQVFLLPPDEMRVMADKIKPLREAAAKKVEALPWDQGVFCTELGYDAIEVNVDAHGGKHFVVLNRTKCIFLEE